MAIAILEGAHARPSGDRLPLWLGVVGGLVMPLIAAILFSTYDYAVMPRWFDNARHLGFVYLAGEVALILYARRHGLDFAVIWRMLPGWARAALAVFLATFWISSAFMSRQPAFSMMLSIGWVINLLFAASLFHLFREKPPESATEMWRGFVLGLATMTVLIAIHFTILPPELRGFEHRLNWDIAIPGFVSSRLFGAWAGAVLSLLTGMAWMQEGSARTQRSIHFGMALAFGLLFWTTTRAALLGWACVLPMSWILAGRPRSHAFYTILPVYLLAMMCVAPMFQPYGHPAFSFFAGGAPTASPDALSSGRLTIWTKALSVASHYPLLGTGAGSSLWLVSINGLAHVQPHNLVVQFLLNWGIIPTVPALMLLASATWHAHVAVRRTIRLLPFVLMLDSLLVNSLFDGMLHFTQFIMLIFGCLAICLAGLKPAGTT